MKNPEVLKSAALTHIAIAIITKVGKINYVPYNDSMDYIATVATRLKKECDLSTNETLKLIDAIHKKSLEYADSLSYPDKAYKVIKACGKKLDSNYDNIIFAKAACFISRAVLHPSPEDNKIDLESATVFMIALMSGHKKGRDFLNRVPEFKEIQKKYEAKRKN